MVKMCVVKSCPTGRKKKNGIGTQVSFFRPSTETRLHRWSESLSMNLKTSDYVCQHHFKEEHIKFYDEIKIGNSIHYLQALRKTLRDDALPTVEHQSHYDVELQQQQKEFFEVNKVSYEEMLEEPCPDTDSEDIKFDNENEYIEESIQSLKTIKRNIEEYSILPPYWFYAEKPNELEFMRFDPTSKRILNHLVLNEDLSITVICSNHEKVDAGDKITAFEDIKSYLKSVQRWPLCVGTQDEKKLYSNKCRGVIFGDEAYKRFQMNPRCKSCRNLRRQLAKYKIDSDVEDNSVNSKHCQCWKHTNAKTKCKLNGRDKMYKKYEKALEEFGSKKISVRALTNKHGISKSAFYNYVNKKIKCGSKQIKLAPEVEDIIIESLNVCSEWRYPMNVLDLKYLIKMYLDSQGIVHTQLRNNIPGNDYINNFLKRNKNKITLNIYPNIRKANTSVTREGVKDYFNDLEKRLANIPSANIVNYYETNLADDPYQRKVIENRKRKYPTAVNSNAVSLMIACSGDGHILPSYIVYKGSNLQHTCIENGPDGARYNSCASGWFNGDIFKDWILTIVIPFFKNKKGKKFLIGDALSSHLSVEIIQLCKDKNIHFAFIPANTSPLTQPLEISFLKPMNTVWRLILDEWKETEGKTSSSIPIDDFPHLLRLLIYQLQINCKKQIANGFRKAGIIPLNINAVISKYPQINDATDIIDTTDYDNTFSKTLQGLHYDETNIELNEIQENIEVLSENTEYEYSDIDEETSIPPEFLKLDDKETGNNKQYKIIIVSKKHVKDAFTKSNLNNKNMSTLINADQHKWNVRRNSEYITPEQETFQSMSGTTDTNQGNEEKQVMFIDSIDLGYEDEVTVN